jgi:hypothetical protein
MKTETKSRQVHADRTKSWIEIVQERVARLRFGTVQVVVHDGRVMQVESVERTRFSISDSTT